jgi:hypothetical protein
MRKFTVQAFNVSWYMYFNGALNLDQGQNLQKLKTQLCRDKIYRKI